MINTKLRILSLLACFVALLGSITAQEALRNHFRNPSGEAKPWTFWYWMYGAVSKEGIKADLEAMKQVGLGGAYLMPIRDSSRFSEYPNPANQLTPQWWEMVRYSMQEADRLADATKPSYSDMQKVENLRTQLPASFITTYEYIPYIGISKIRDPKNVSTYFKYDDSGRLIKKTDHKGELISSYKYSNNL
jgi:YD repeat-containing protein